MSRAVMTAIDESFNELGYNHESIGAEFHHSRSASPKEIYREYCLSKMMYRQWLLPLLKEEAPPVRSVRFNRHQSCTALMYWDEVRRDQYNLACRMLVAAIGVAFIVGGLSHLL